MHEIAFEDVTKVYPDGPTALDHLGLTVAAGEMFGIVGPSGCGKTTALRILAGFEPPTSGRVRIGGRDVTELATRDRALGLITQDNLLMSHLTARGNIRFPLAVRSRQGSGPVDDRVQLEATRLGLQHLLDRRPETLSEGERRAVQLARAVISAPATLLMDEPLAHLEDQVRHRLRSDVVRIHRMRGLTSILVTASQADAMAMCDRIAVLFDGVVHQVGTPMEIYRQPATASVASFFGEPSMNVLEARVQLDGPVRQLSVLDRSIPFWTPLLDDYANRTVLIGIRAEDIVIGVGAADGIEAEITATEPLGHRTLAAATTREDTVLRLLLPGAPAPQGTLLDVAIPPERLHLFDPGTGLAILHPATP